MYSTYANPYAPANDVFLITIRKRIMITSPQPQQGQAMTPKQAAFVSEYMIDHNGTQAAIRAGYSKRTARQQA